MLCLISHAKTMAATSRVKAPAATLPRFSEDAKEIALNMAQFTAEEVGKALKINPRLAAENYLRFQHFFSPDNKPLQALLAYTGVVFKNIHPQILRTKTLILPNTTFASLLSVMACSVRSTASNLTVWSLV